MKTIILCANGLEECEALITYDLLTRANIDVYLVGTEKYVVSSHNVKFETNLLLDEINLEECECMILPGGMPGMKNLETNPLVQNAIDYFVSQNKYIAAICSAPSILIHKGLLKDNKFTCYPGYETGLTPTKEKATQDGKFITGNGLGGTIEFALKIIENLKGKEISDKVMKTIQY